MRSKPTMRRLYVLLILMAVITAGLFIYNHTREDRWRKLPWGGEVRVVDVTFEAHAHFEVGRSILEPLRRRFGVRWRHFIGSSKLRVQSRLREQTLIIWFHSRKNQTPPADHFNNILRALVVNDQVILSSTGEGAGDENHELDGISFRSAPLTEKRFHIRLINKEQTMNFDIANPFYSELKKP
jgi:hypothetical protein